MKRLEGKVALVTGAARGIGREYALRLAKLGASVGVIDIDLKSYQHFEREKEAIQHETVVDEIISNGGRAFGIEADISNEEQVTRAVAKIAKELGEISILIANAGGGSGAVTENSASEIESDQLKLVMERNLYGTIYSVKAVKDNMMKSGYGKIVTVTSVAGMQSNEKGTYAHYGATKGAIVNYTKYLAQDLGPYNITVNAIAPEI